MHVHQEISNVALTRKEIVFLLKNSPEFFIQFFLGEQVVKDVPGLHLVIWDGMNNSEYKRFGCAVPRDHAKTTLAKLSAVRHFMFTDFSFVIYASNTNTIATDACRDIYEFFYCENFVSVFGKPEEIQKSESLSIWRFKIPEIEEGRGRKECILRAIGTMQQMRGINIKNLRPELAIVDDAETDEIVDSPIQSLKFRNWVYGPFLKALSRARNKVIWLGNLLSEKSLLAEIVVDKLWNPMIFGALAVHEDTKEMVAIWPDRWSKEELIEDFLEYARRGLIGRWFCEMMNIAGEGKNGFTGDHIYLQPQPLPEELEFCFITIDPAFGEDSHNDNTCVCVHGIRKEDSLPMVVDSWLGKCNEVQMWEIAKGLAMKWDAYAWGIESVAAQKLLITLFTLYKTRDGIGSEMEFFPLMSGSGDPKVQRISSFCGMMYEKQYALYEGAFEIVNQVIKYNMKRKSNDDDGIDAAAYGPIMLAQYEPAIRSLALFGKIEVTEILQGMDICNV